MAARKVLDRGANGSRVPPSARLIVGNCRIHLLGTVAGFVPDGQRVHEAIQEGAAAIACCVPAEDLATLDLLREKPELMSEMAQPDDLEERRLGGLGNFGETQIPSPDVVAAHEEAHRAQLPLEPLDLGDAHHTTLYTQFVKLRHVVQGNSARNRLRKSLPEAEDAYDFQRRWDATLLKSKGQQRLEAARLDHIEARLRDVAAKHPTLVAVVPVLHFEALAQRLGKPGHQPMN